MKIPENIKKKVKFDDFEDFEGVEGLDGVVLYDGIVHVVYDCVGDDVYTLIEKAKFDSILFDETVEKVKKAREAKEVFKRK